MNLNASFIVLLISSVPSFAQNSYMHFKIEGQAIYTSSDQVPSDSDPINMEACHFLVHLLSFIGRTRKEYNPNGKKPINWALGFEGRTSLGNSSQGIITEAYGKVSVGVFELKAGCSKDVMGLVGDSSF